jgi:hypothetical protein
VAIACPACMTLGLAQSCAGYVTTVINGTDMVPTMSLGEHGMGLIGACCDAFMLHVGDTATGGVRRRGSSVHPFKSP